MNLQGFLTSEGRLHNGDSKVFGVYVGVELVSKIKEFSFQS